MRWDDHIVCATCGVEAVAAVGICAICADERQYVPASGQEWVTLGEARSAGARLELRERELGIFGLAPTDAVGIGQQAKIIRTAAGSVMVDVPASIDEATIAAVRAIGGIDHIVASHPHMYGVQSLWARAFDATVWISEADASWLAVWPDRVRLLSAEAEIVPGVVATVLGGHFPGALVVHTGGSDGAGVLLSGDTIFPTPDGWVTFLRSYPNMIPLSPAVVRRIADQVTERFTFDRVYGNFEDAVSADGNAVVLRSAERYIRWVSGEFDHRT